MYHEPVLKDEVVKLLITDKTGVYVDGTVGGGGHAEAILEHLSPEGRLVGIDVDEEALEFSAQRLQKFGDRVILKEGNFRDLPEILASLQIHAINGLLLDLGVSSHQIDTPERGFSFTQEGPLDMRMGRRQPQTARELVNEASEQELSRIFKEFGEEKWHRRIARAIVQARKKASIETTRQLQEIVSRVLPPPHRIKSLARIFQALRIAVNQELQNLAEALAKSLDLLKSGGRLAVISYHSLEDRLVKNFMRSEASRCICPPETPVCVCGRPGTVKILTRRPVRPSEEEVKRNPRSRSAKLRVAEKI